MPLSIGIVGLPNVGKSTLFNALTKKQVEASNYPFCTINPNVGVVQVPDERLYKLAEISKPKKITPTVIEFVDIAGLVKDAHKGEGLGNQFLAHIRECDAICEVVREFKDDNVIHVNGKIDPAGDKETINLELIFADLATVQKRLDKTSKEAKSGDKKAAALKSELEKIKIALESGKAVHDLDLSEEEKAQTKDLSLLTLKPIIYVLNTSAEAEPETPQTPLVKGGKEEKIPPTPFVKGAAGKAEGQNTPLIKGAGGFEGKVVKINAKLEAEIAGLSEAEQAEYIKEFGLEQSGLDKLIKIAYEALGLITFLTTVLDETRAWTVKRGTKALEAAGVIHTDFAKGFIRAEIINWQKLVEVGSEQTARERGLIRTEGKDYIIQDGDVCHFLFSN